jgi:hypothetical protein
MLRGRAVVTRSKTGSARSSACRSYVSTAPRTDRPPGAQLSDTWSEAWGASQAFYEAQARGQIPEEEIFEPWLTLDLNEDGTYSFRDISAPSRRLVFRLHEAGILTEWGPTDASRGPTRDDPEHAEGYTWVHTTDGYLVVGHARIRSYSFSAVRAEDLADEISHLDLAGRLSRLTEGDRSVLVKPGSVILPEIGASSGWSGGWCVDPSAA